MTTLAARYLFALTLLLITLTASAQVTQRHVVIYSEGVRMSGTVYYLQAQEGKKLPTVILSHGWGGMAGLLRPEAERFARAGYFALAFDYRGWGDSAMPRAGRAARSAIRHRACARSASFAAPPSAKAFCAMRRSTTSPA